MRFVGPFFERSGVADDEFDLPPGSRAEALVQAIVERYPPLKDLFADRNAVALLRNGSAVDHDAALEDGDEVIVMPAIGGGALLRALFLP